MKGDKCYKLRVRDIGNKCLDTEGDWDGTYDTSYEWVIEDENGLEVSGMGGYSTYEKAREAGELAWIKYGGNK